MILTGYKNNISRNSYMEFEEVYFWTDTINGWNRLLTSDAYKKVIISCWQELVFRNKISIYGFVIMPNHLHVVWEMKEPNGKERPSASFNKYTSHMFLKYMRKSHSSALSHFKVDELVDRRYRFWQRDPLAVWMDSKKKVEQKIIYMHTNPIQERWSLSERPEEYRWSSAKFYETGKDEFGILTHYAERF